MESIQNTVQSRCTVFFCKKLSFMDGEFRAPARDGVFSGPISFLLRKKETGPDSQRKNAKYCEGPLPPFTYPL